MSQSPKTTNKVSGAAGRLARAFWGLGPAQWFLVFGLLFGLAFAILTPPLSTPDEHNHFLRAYHISEGGIIAEKTKTGTGADLPVNIHFTGVALEDFSYGRVGTIDDIHAGKDRTFMRFENTALYSPVAYAPQALGVFLGRLFDTSIIYLIYLARIFNVLAYIAVVYAAIRMLPFGKWAGVVIGLLPLHILLSGTASADPFTTALAFLAVATVLRLRTFKRSMTGREIALLFVLTVVLALCKLPFVLFLAFYFLIPARALGGTLKRWLLLVGGLLLTAIVVGGTWLMLARAASSPYGPEFVDNAAQIAFLLEHPLSFLQIFLTTYFSNFSTNFLQQYVGSIGLLEAWPPLWATLLYTAFLTLTLFPLRVAAGALKGLEKALVAAIGILCVLTTSVILFITWTAPGWSWIDGVQVRYFTPLLILAIPLIAVRSKTAKQTQEGGLSPVWYRTMPVLFLVYVLWLAIDWFY